MAALAHEGVVADVLEPVVREGEVPQSGGEGKSVRDGSFRRQLDQHRFRARGAHEGVRRQDLAVLRRSGSHLSASGAGDCPLPVKVLAGRDRI